MDKYVDLFNDSDDERKISGKTKTNGDDNSVQCVGTTHFNLDGSIVWNAEKGITPVKASLEINDDLASLPIKKKNEMLRFIITGNPVPYRRVKHHVKMNKAGGYWKNHQDSNKFDKERIRESISQQMETLGYGNVTQEPFFEREDLLMMELEFYRALPNTAFVNDDRSKPLKSHLSSTMNLPDRSTPDLDNLCKLILDSFQSVLYIDDCQVVRLIATKMLDLEFPHDGKTEVRIRKIRYEELPEPSNPLLRPDIAIQSDRYII